MNYCKSSILHVDNTHYIKVSSLCGWEIRRRLTSDGKKMKSQICKYNDKLKIGLGVVTETSCQIWYSCNEVVPTFDWRKISRRIKPQWGQLLTQTRVEPVTCWIQWHCHGCRLQNHLYCVNQLNMLFDTNVDCYSVKLITRKTRKICVQWNSEDWRKFLPG
jgi:hypothetical protein